MRRLVAFVVLIALAGCTDRLARDSKPDPSSPPAVVGFDDLAAVLFDQPPAGYVADPGETKGLTLEDVAGGADDPESERRRLQDHGFVRGYIRTWVSDDDSESVVYALVYEFADAAGAQADAKDGIDEARADGETLFPVPGIEGATGITHKPAPGDEGDEATFHAVVFVRGARYFLVAIGGPTEHSSTEAIDLARRMNAKATA